MLIQQKQEKTDIRLSFEALIVIFSCFHLNQHQLSCRLSHEDEMNNIMRFNLQRTIMTVVKVWNNFQASVHVDHMTHFHTVEATITPQ